MTTFVLVHGSFQGGWIWKRVAKLLEAEGHEVYRPTLDGCAERKGGLRAEITLASMGKELADLFFYEDLEDVVFVATSSGGMVLCEAAWQVPDRIRRLVFIDAIVPRPGETAPIINERSKTPLENMVYGLPPEQAHERAYLGLEPELREWALARYTQQPLRPTEQPVDLVGFWNRSWKVDVLRCTGSERPMASHQRRTAELLEGSYREMEAGHYPMLTEPRELAAYLLECAAH